MGTILRLIDIICACSSAGLVAQMRANGNQWVQKDVTVTLAQAYGYCWGVERAVQMAYEARKQYPEQRMHITNEIIHNPAVNQVPSPSTTHHLQSSSCRSLKYYTAKY